MEKIKVNMSPNPLDVQTIHASQNDTEARQWEFELHNNGELIDTSDVKEQLVFKTYKGGTEQLLPENGSTPTTSPFIGDIRYPQGLLTDQEFTYRQSPTEEDGLAKITDVKGNTIVWNQLLRNGNFEITTGWATSGRGTLTVSNNVATITPLRSGLIVTGPVITITSGHKYLLSVEVKADSTSVWVGTQYNDVHARLYSNGTNQWQRMTAIVSNFANDSTTAPVFGDGRTSGWTASQIRNFMFIDLTQMGLDITDPSEFTSLFPLSYYSYNQGSLLSFNGSGIKTVGKNQIKLSADTLVSSQRIKVNYLDNGAVFTANGTYSRAGYTCKTIKGQQYTLSFKGFSNANFGAVYISNDLDWNTNYGRIILGSTETNQSLTFTADSELFFVGFYLTNTGTSGSMTIKDIQLELGSSVTSYVPYTSSTLSLPISTYFPNGMKSAGSVYDELTPIKAITRIGAVDLGSLTWTYQSANTRFYATIDNMPLKPVRTMTLPNPLYTSLIGGSISSSTDKVIYNGGNERRIYIHDLSYTSAEDFKQAMQGVYLYYELATPTETSFTTASLVTENTEIPLSNEDGTLIGKCTEQLSENPGFIDAKIKLSDSDGECYSNKIQLHIERKPS